MRASALLLALALGAATGACRAPRSASAPIADQRPAEVDRRQIASTVWIGQTSGTVVTGFASAVVLDPRTLLTNAHVWAEDEAWWKVPLPVERELALYRRGRTGTVRFQGGEGQVEMPGQLEHVRFRLVASGLEPDPAAKPPDHGDWVVLETDTPRWDPADAAVPDPHAGEPQWRVPEGTALLVVGYSSIFDGGALRAPASSDGEQDTPGWQQLEPFLARGPYTLAGEALDLDGQPAVSYPTDWPAPSGHSGGGVYLRDEATGALRLVGLFEAWTPVRMKVTSRYAPLGLAALSFDRSVDREGGVLLYEPLAPILDAAAEPRGR